MSDRDAKPDRASPKAGQHSKVGAQGRNAEPQAQRDFGDSAGYCGGGAALDYQQVVGESPLPPDKANPLDEIIPRKPAGTNPAGQGDDA